MSDARPAGPVTPPFLETKEYRRFAEFCDACRCDRYIGLCHGPPVVGKTISARHYAQWERLEQTFASQRFDLDAVAAPDLADYRSVVYTPSMTPTPNRLADDLADLRWRLDLAVEAAREPDADAREIAFPRGRSTELVLVDEADRLTFPTLERLRDAYDRGRFGVVLTGMPGIEKRLARYAQFYSRVGFVHQFRALSADELRFILERKWPELGLAVDLTDFTDVEAMGAIIWITGGNFRLLQRLLAQIARILEINHLHQVTKEVVDTARIAWSSVSAK